MAKSKLTITKRFVPVSDRLSRKDAIRYGTYLDQLAEGQLDRLTADEVVADARRRSSPLHNWFDWDDSTAAEQYRLAQARLLLRSIAVVYVRPNNQEDTVRMFHAIRQTGQTQQVYIGIKTVFSEKEYREQVIQDALQEAESWMARYKQYVELANIFKAIEEAAKKLRKK